MGRLTAVVVGAGWAGEGHTLAMRQAGVDVVALCGRSPDAVSGAAQRLAVPEPSTNWREVMRRVRPSIVCIGTPATVRGEIIEEAVDLGAHIFCDKPLAVNGAEAGRLHRLVAQRPALKHAYASTYRYDPSVAWMAELVGDGRIGRVSEIELCSRGGRFSAVRPWSWMLDIEMGGGSLNNGFTHWLEVMARICGLPPRRVAGLTRVRRFRAPVVEGVHDFRSWMSLPLSAEQSANAEEWRDCITERDCHALLAFGDGDQAVSGYFAMNQRAENWPAEGLRVFGDGGTIVAADLGGCTFDVTLRPKGRVAAQRLPVPERLLRQAPSGPELPERVQARWNALALDFVGDIRGTEHAPYPTFLDGWRTQVAIDAMRGGAGWVDLPR